jgi:hypothetical protein
MGSSEVRKATNEGLFREVNEQIEAIAKDFAEPEHIEFVCECANVACTTRLALSLAEYEDVRAYPARFAIAPGHEDLEVDRVVVQHEGYAVVEKIGAAREVAEQQDPRA